MIDYVLDDEDGLFGVATAAERYQAAIDYVERAIATAQAPPLWSTVIPAVALASMYGGNLATTTARQDLVAIKKRWAAASSDTERDQVARDAELLADRVEENVPGAPTDRQRTNLFSGEVPSSTPAASFPSAIVDEVKADAKAAAEVVDKVGDELAGVGKWLLLGGALLGGAYLYSRRR